jgi:hypothetical protein
MEGNDFLIFVILLYCDPSSSFAILFWSSAIVFLLIKENFTYHEPAGCRLLCHVGL